MSASRLSLSSLSTYQGLSTSRLQSLYSDISRQKLSNPTSFQSNVEWWRRTLESLVSRGWQAGAPDRLVLHANTGLLELLRYEGAGKPLSLGTVITELCEIKVLISLDQFLSSTRSVYDPGSLPWRIASYVVGRPVWWALQQLNVVDEDGGHESERERWKRVQGDFVIISLLEKAADAVLLHQRSRTTISLADSLFTMESFRTEFGPVISSEGSVSAVDVKVLVKYLERDKKAVVVDKEVIKFIDGSLDNRTEITAVDRGVLELKSAVANMQSQLDEIQRRIEDRTRKISEALRQKQKELALSYLRSRKQLEELFSRRLGSLEMLQSTMIRVEGAAGDVEIMKSYKSSAATLRTILAHPSLQRDRIDETMDALASATADQKEIDDLIRVNMDTIHQPADDAELEAELAGLVAEAEKEKAEVEETRVLERQRRLEDMETSSPASVPKRAGLEKGEAGTLDTGALDGKTQEDLLWEQRWKDAQAEKRAQAGRDRIEETRKRATWEEEQRPTQAA